MVGACGSTNCGGVERGVSLRGMALQKQKNKRLTPKRERSCQVAQVHPSPDRLEFSPTQVNKETSHKGRSSCECIQLPAHSLYCRPSVPRISII